MKKSHKLLLLLSACASTVVLAVINSSFGPMLGPVTEHYLDGDGASQGYPNSAMQAGCIAAVILLMLFGGRLTVKAKTLLLTVSAAVMCVGMILLGTSPSFTTFVLLFAFVGLAYGASDVTSSALVADAYGESSSGMMCLLHGSHGAAGIAAPILVSAVLASSDKWSLPYTLIGVFILAIAVFLLIVFAKENTPDSVSGSSFVPFDKALLPIALPIFFYGIYLVGMINYTVRYESTLIEREDGAALTLSMLYLGLTASRLILPLLHIKPTLYLRISPIVSAVLLAVGVALGNGVVYIVCAALSSFIAGAFIPVAISEACELMPGRTTGASTWMNLAMLAGNGIASPLIGAVSGSLGLGIAMMIPPTALLLAFAASFISVGKNK